MKLLEDVLSFDSDLLLRSGWIEVFFLPTFMVDLFFLLRPIFAYKDYNKTTTDSKTTVEYREKHYIKPGYK